MRLSLSAQAHVILTDFIGKGDKVIDATCGNGYDSLFLAKNVAPLGIVYSFDVQYAAIKATYQRLQQTDLIEFIKLFQTGHEFMGDVIPKHDQGLIKAVMFNLGYLPHSDKKIITRQRTTLMALNTAISLLSPHAIITILAYPGHLGGSDELHTVAHWCTQLSSEFTTEIIKSTHSNTTTPQLFVVRYNAST